VQTRRFLPPNARGTRNVEYIYARLEQYNGISQRLASNRLHSIKAAAELGPADDVLFDLCGGVYDLVTREWRGSLTDGGAQPDE
jgi:hypothetical protein